MKVKDFFEKLVRIVKYNNDQLFTAWLTGRQFEKWLQLEILTELMNHYEDCWEDFREYFHSEYRAKLTQRGKDKRDYKQVDLYISNGKNDSNDYMFIELKTGFGKARTIPVAGIIEDFRWLTKIRKNEGAKDRIAAIVLLSCKEEFLDQAKKEISAGIGKKPSHSQTTTITKKCIVKGENVTVHVLVAIWKMKKVR